MAFHFHYPGGKLINDIFLYTFTSDMVPKERYYRRFNLKAGFIEKLWYVFGQDCLYVFRAKEFDFV